MLLRLRMQIHLYILELLLTKYLKSMPLPLIYKYIRKKRIKVNGKKVDVERVNKGFMAVPVKAGENQIEFTYKTPGLSLGIIITLLALLVWIFYTVISVILNKKGMPAATEYPEGYKLIETFIEK